jgi:transcription initiation factor IIE alpha subunit
MIPKVVSEAEKRVVYALEEHYALDFDSLRIVTQLSEKELGRVLEMLKRKKIVDWQ